MDEFNYQDFITLYPEFTNISPSQFANFLIEAKLILGKYCLTGAVLPVIIYKTIAHLSALSMTGSVGRVSSGTQGSTNVTLDFQSYGPGASWWNQTPYGAFIYTHIILPKRLGGKYAI